VNDKLILGDDFVENYSPVRKEFLENLHSAVSLIFSSIEPFVMTAKQSRKCGYCLSGFVRPLIILLSGSEFY